MTLIQNTAATEDAEAPTSAEQTPNESITDFVNSLEATASALTSYGLPTDVQSTVTSSPLPDVRCCCRCCFPSSLTCALCDGNSLTTASDCANKPPAAPVDRETPKFQAPSRLEGSQFSDRLALAEEFVKSEQLTEKLGALPANEKIDLGFKTTDLIIDCEYDGAECSVDRDFKSFYNAMHGNCYVFNSGWNETLKSATRSGKQHGLTLTMNIQQDQYVSEVGNTAGVIVLVQQQNLMPFPEDHGILVSPGYETEVRVTMTSVKRRPAPYGSCSDDGEEASDVFSEKYSTHYSTEACLKTCYQRHVIERCGCSDAHYPAVNAAAFNYVKVPICSVANITQDDCKYGVRKEFSVNKLPCNCPDRCTEIILRSESSVSHWPSTRTKRQVLRRLQDKLGDDFNINDDELVRNNLLRLDIFYEQLSYKELVEKPAYPAVQFVADLGGVLGLWFGFALMTFIELCEFTTDLMILSIWKLKRRQ